MHRTQAVLFKIRTYCENIKNIPIKYHADLLEALKPDSRVTPISLHQKEDYRERIRAIWLEEYDRQFLALQKLNVNKI